MPAGGLSRVKMILVDTSVWVDHFRKGISLLGDLLTAGEVTTHPFVIGELACGNLSNRKEILTLLSSLPAVKLAAHSEALYLVERHGLSGCGLGWIDVHLLASALLSGVDLWTMDRRLKAAGENMGLTWKSRSIQKRKESDLPPLPEFSGGGSRVNLASRDALCDAMEG